MNTSDVVEFFLTNTSEQSNPSLRFQSVNNEEIHRINSSANETDVDYICYVDKMTTIFKKERSDPNDLNSEDDRNALEKLISNNTVRFFKECFFSPLYSNMLSGVLVFAEIGMYKAGRPIFKNISLRKEEEDEDEDEAFSFQMSRERLVCDLNRIIQTLPTGNIPFEDFKKHMSSIFKDQELCVFTYGQKQRISTITRNLVDLASYGGRLELALGTEFNFDEYFVTNSYSKESSRFQFSNFLSNVSCNIEITDQNISSSKYPNSYRICAYNTLQHDRKHLCFEIGKRRDVTVTSQQLFYPYYDSIVKNINQLNVLPEFIDRSLFRLEVYFTINSAPDFGTCKTSIKSIPNWLHLVKIPKQTLSIYLMGYVQKLLELAEICKIRERHGSTLYFLYLYGKFIGGITSSERMTVNFMRDNFGFNLPQTFYNAETEKMSAEFYKLINGPKIWRMLVNVFGKRNTNFDEKLFFALSFYWECPASLSSEYTQHFVMKIKRFFLIYAEKCRASDETPKEFVSPSKFLSMFARKNLENYFVQKIVKYINQFSERGSDSYEKICTSLMDCKVFFFYNRTIFFVKGMYEKESSYEISIESISSFVKTYNYKQCCEVFEDCTPSSNDFWGIRNFLERFNNRFATFFRGYSSAQRIILPTNSTDHEFVLRILFAKIPSKEQGFEEDELVNIVDLFRNINEFLFLLPTPCLWDFVRMITISLIENAAIDYFVL